MTAKIQCRRSNGRDMERKLALASTVMVNAVPRALRDAVKLSEEMLDGAIVSMVGGDRRMRNMPSRRLAARGGVRNQNKSAGKAAVGPVGPVALVDQGASPHMIGVGKQSSAKRVTRFAGVSQGYGVRRSRDLALGRKVKVLSWTANGQRVYRRAPLFHPGTTGKNRWVPTRDGPLARALPKVMAFPVTRSMATLWRA